SSTKENSMRSPSPLFLLIVLGLAGYLVGALAGALGSIGIYLLIHGVLPSPPRAIGEYSAPYGFVGSLLGLILGGCGGFRSGYWLARGEVSPRGQSGVREP